MAVGWARDGAVAEQIEASINDELARMKAQVSSKESLTHCIECDEAISERRRKAVVGVVRCIQCQHAFDAKPKPSVGLNRRGSKDSQLK